MNIVVLERSSVGTDVSVDSFGQFGKLTCYLNTAPEDVADRVADAHIIICNKLPMNAHTLKKAACVQLICQFATGYDNIDLDYCQSRGIYVCNVPDYCSDAVAQHTFAMLFYVLEKLRHYDDFVKSGAYAAQDRFSNFDLPFMEISGKTWGIIVLDISGAVLRISPQPLAAALFIILFPDRTAVQFIREFLLMYWHHLQTYFLSTARSLTAQDI